MRRPFRDARQVRVGVVVVAVTRPAYRAIRRVRVIEFCNKALEAAARPVCKFGDIVGSNHSLFTGRFAAGRPDVPQAFDRASG